MPKPKRTTAKWRNTPDEVLLSTTSRSMPDRAESLCPTHETVIRAACTDEPTARAIIDAWAFHAPVVKIGVRA